MILRVKDLPATIRDLIARTEGARLQNILMRIPDKVCAAGFSVLSEGERHRLYAVLGSIKARRVREEILLESRRRTGAPARARLLRSFLAYFGARLPEAPKVWLRPIRGRKDRA